MHEALAGASTDAPGRRVKLPMPYRVSMMAAGSLLLWSMILVPFLA